MESILSRLVSNVGFKFPDLLAWEEQVFPGPALPVGILWLKALYCRILDLWMAGRQPMNLSPMSRS